LATATNDEVDEIRRRMAQIRHELHKDVKEVVAGAGAVTDWRRYVRTYPWAAVGVAAVLGYVVIPKRRRRVPRDVARQSDVAEVGALLKQAHEDSLPESDEKKQRKSLVGAAFAMLAPLAWRVAQNYAMGYLEQWIAQQQQQAMATVGPPPQVNPTTSRRPAGPRGA